MNAEDRAEVLAGIAQDIADEGLREKIMRLAVEGVRGQVPPDKEHAVAAAVLGECLARMACVSLAGMNEKNFKNALQWMAVGVIEVAHDIRRAIEGNQK